MGGHVGGAVASRLAVEAVSAWFDRMGPPAGQPVDAGLIEPAVHEANQAVWDHARANPDLQGMGTTATLLMLQGRHGLLAHVGDSRAYRVRSGRLEQLSRDHTLVSEQVRLGHLTEEQAKTHPGRHILNRVLGVREFISVDTGLIDIQAGDRFLLCTDGLTGMVTDSEIAQILADVEARDPAVAVANLIDVALQHGGEDNVTVGIIDVHAVPVTCPGWFSPSAWWHRWREFRRKKR